MPSRLRRRLRRAIDSATDYVRDAINSVQDRSYHINVFHREVSDLWRRDDRMLKKAERRVERDNAAYAESVAESGRLREANQAARLSRQMMGGQRMARLLGGDGLGGLGENAYRPMNRMLGGGA